MFVGHRLGGLCVDECAQVMRLLFDRRHWWLTLLIVVGAIVMVALGVWQLGRLADRQAQNSRTRAELAGPPVDLNHAARADLLAMEFRAVEATGTYDFGQEVVLLRQRWVTRPGVHLLTPLRLAGVADAVLVDRGWVPLEDADAARRAQYAAPSGEVTVRGVLRVPPMDTGFSLPEPAVMPGSRQTEWNVVRLDRLARQLPYPLLPVYLQLAPDPNSTGLPARPEVSVDLSDGSHLSYAVQWFTFAAVTLGAYAVYLRGRARQT